MKKIEAVIVDDEIRNVKILEHFISNYCPEIEVVDIAINVKDAILLINEKRPQLIFLDVVLGDNTCFDILEKINYLETKIVFVTAHEEYATRAFKYNALDYLLKPISIKDLERVVSKLGKDIKNDNFTLDSQIESLMEAFKKRESQNFIAIFSLNKIEFIKRRDIVFLKSDGRYTIFFLSNGQEIVSSKNLGEYETMIGDSVFFRIHKSYIVNTTFIKAINKKDGPVCELINDVSLPIGRRRLDEFTLFVQSI